MYKILFMSLVSFLISTNVFATLYYSHDLGHGNISPGKMLRLNVDPFFIQRGKPYKVQCTLNTRATSKILIALDQTYADNFPTTLNGAELGSIANDNIITDLAAGTSYLVIDLKPSKGMHLQFTNLARTGEVEITNCTATNII